MNDKYITLLTTEEGWTVDAMPTPISVHVYLFTRPVPMDRAGRGLDAAQHDCVLRGWFWGGWGSVESRSVSLARRLIARQRASQRGNGVIEKSVAALRALAEANR